MSCCGPHGHENTTNDEETASTHGASHEGHQGGPPATAREAGSHGSHSSCGCGGGGNWMFIVMVGLLLGFFALSYLLR